MNTLLFLTGKFSLDVARSFNVDNYSSYNFWSRRISQSNIPSSISVNEVDYNLFIFTVSYKTKMLIIYNTERKEVLLSTNNKYSHVTFGSLKLIKKFLSNATLNFNEEEWRIIIFCKNNIVKETNFDWKNIHKITWNFIYSFTENFMSGRLISILNNIPPNLSYLNNQINDNFTFGIEFEFIATSYNDILLAFAQKSLKIIDKSGQYGKSSVASWVLCYDSSLETSENFPCKCELTTPRLEGQKGLQILYTYMLVLKQLETDNKIKVNKSCGTHIHLGRFGTDVEIVKKFWSLWQNYDKQLDYVLPPSRRDNGYCRSLCARSYEDFKNEKYMKISTRNFFVNGTIENRQHNGTLSFEKISNWLILNQKMLLYSISIEETKIMESNLMSLFLLIQLHNASIEFFISRKIVLNNLSSVFSEENS